MREFFLVVLAVSAPFLIGAFMSHYFNYRSALLQRTTDAAKEAAERDNAELKQQIKALKERVEVLEAIVTDSKYDLGRKIANL